MVNTYSQRSPWNTLVTRGAQDVANLLTAHAGLQGLDLLLGHEVALHDIDFVGSDGIGDTVRGAIDTVAAGQCRCDCQRQGQTCAATGLNMHG
jgi:hypothetical protein